MFRSEQLLSEFDQRGSRGKTAISLPPTGWKIHIYSRVSGSGEGPQRKCAHSQVLAPSNDLSAAVKVFPSIGETVRVA